MDGKILFALVLSLVLASLSARLVSWAYRRKMVKLMASGATPQDNTEHSGPVVSASSGDDSRTHVEWLSPAAHRRAGVRLALVLIITSLLIGVSVAWFNLMFVYKDGGFGPIKLAIMGAIYTAPIIPVLGMLWRWSWRRIVGAACLYLLAAVLIVWVRSDDGQSLTGVFLWLLAQIGLPLAAILILTGSGKTRAAAPYLFPAFAVLTTSSILGLDALEGAISSTFSGIIAALARLFGAVFTFVLFAVVPWFLAFWPIRALARRLARAYREKKFSEVIYLFAGYWLVSLLFYALPPFHSVGFAAFAVLFAWLWIPAVIKVARPVLVRKRNAPTLLVLRVFRRDAEVQSLFDQVIERWRASGSVALIAGTDLVSRTMDPDDLFAYIHGSLLDRFIRDEGMLRDQLSKLDTIPDPDGRYRVNDFYCFDTTWQTVLRALVNRADCVLMDLRGLHAKNYGCLFELETLARASHLGKIILLTDDKTNQQAARAALGREGEGRRIVLEDAGSMDNSKVNQVLEKLLVKAAA